MFKFKKSQPWGIDLAAALGIFIVAIGIFYVYSINLSNESEENLNNLKTDGEILLSIVLSEGYPLNWTNESVVNIGLISDSKINETKLEIFYNMSYENYQRTKNLFRTKYDYFLFFEENITVNGESKRGIGKPGTDIENINAINLIKISRVTIYQDKPVMIYLYIWEE